MFFPFHGSSSSIFTTWLTRGEDLYTHSLYIIFDRRILFYYYYFVSSHFFFKFRDSFLTILVLLTWHKDYIFVCCVYCIYFEKSVIEFFFFCLFPFLILQIECRLLDYKVIWLYFIRRCIQSTWHVFVSIKINLC